MQRQFMGCITLSTDAVTDQGVRQRQTAHLLNRSDGNDGITIVVVAEPVSRSAIDRCRSSFLPQ